MYYNLIEVNNARLWSYIEETVNLLVYLHPPLKLKEEGELLKNIPANEHAACLFLQKWIYSAVIFIKFDNGVDRHHELVVFWLWRGAERKQKTPIFGRQDVSNIFKIMSDGLRNKSKMGLGFLCGTNNYGCWVNFWLILIDKGIIYIL